MADQEKTAFVLNIPKEEADQLVQAATESKNKRGKGPQELIIKPVDGTIQAGAASKNARKHVTEQIAEDYDKEEA
ncbi:hypothetical protein N7540_005574 [Penicillium herquei]|nr:hypothetical protein N7540_005574 [Penicillium herquei]